MLVFVLNQTQKANTGKIQTPVYENVREFGDLGPVSETSEAGFFVSGGHELHRAVDSLSSVGSSRKYAIVFPSQLR